jgi:hypothetical protein
MHLPNTGPEGTEYASESERDEDIVEDATLQAPDGALGVRRCFPLPKCPIVEAECFGKKTSLLTQMIAIMLPVLRIKSTVSIKIFRIYS